MTTQLEIESKFDAEPGQALPDLVGVAGVVATAASAEMVLTAGYFDTESLALGSAGATLRRRTGGTDDGWHLKLSVADGERLEVHRALGRSGTPPAALASLVQAMTRGDALRPGGHAGHPTGGAPAAGGRRSRPGRDRRRPGDR